MRQYVAEGRREMRLLEQRCPEPGLSLGSELRWSIRHPLTWVGGRLSIQMLRRFNTPRVRNIEYQEWVSEICIAGNDGYYSPT